jgi:hypothetical protein
MHNLKDIISGIVVDEGSHNLLVEDNGNDISKILNEKKLSYRLVDYNELDVQGNSLILFLKDETLIRSYDHIGRMTHSFQEKFMVIRKLNTQDYITDTHNMLMSLGFKMLFELNENNLFYFFYAYNISNYKNIPDWLNSDNWANPELWEK